MRRLLRILFSSILLFSIQLPSDSLSATRGIRNVAENEYTPFLYKDYHALVVGVSDYEQWPNLPNAVKDAKEIASGLREFGFSMLLQFAFNGLYCRFVSFLFCQ